MESKQKPEYSHQDEIEAVYKIEYSLRVEINRRDEKILDLEYQNAKYCRKIEWLEDRIISLEDELSRIRRRSKERL